MNPTVKELETRIVLLERHLEVVEKTMFAMSELIKRLMDLMQELGKFGEKNR